MSAILTDMASGSGKLLSGASSAALSLVGGWKTDLMIGAAALAILGATYGGGFLKGEQHAAQAQAKAAQAVATQQVAAVVAQEQKDAADAAARAGRDQVRVTQLQTQLDTITANYSSLQKVLNAKPDLDPDVHVRVGDVRLLDAVDNSAGAGEQGVPNPASVAAFQEQAASVSTLRDLVADDLAVRTQYEELAATHDKLVDWVQVELIDPQTNTAPIKK